MAAVTICSDSEAQENKVCHSFHYLSIYLPRSNGTNLYAGQKATIRTGHRTTDWFQIGKGVRQGCLLLPCLFNLHVEYIMQNAGLDEAGINLLGEISTTSDV